MLCGRFAPTPSGVLHLGNALTALLSWLHVRRAGGRYILRIEDIDRARSRAELARQACDDLRWLGLDWDEGPGAGGPHGPYYQSERTELYAEALARLQAAGHLYPCYCSRAQLMAIASAPHGLAAEGPVYPGTCRRLTPEERRAREAGGKTPSLRFALPDEPVAFVDLVAGPQHFPPGAGGDFVVRRADGVIGYQLAVVVDDALMGVTHVLRGGDLLDSTPRQILLYRALGWPVPQFGHLPLLLGPDGARLAKRHGAVTLAGIRAAGTRPEAVAGHLAYLAGLIDRPEPVRPQELIPCFDLARIPREPVRVPQETIAALNGGIG
ncbi:glutamyl-tRNA synthetase [Symbiobacterium terraclitae]|uniref:Glutamyl-Q tRNA(Asp) synthetase n=1 Tax=Symbiobacterium terraclitae TaxID=557451 RepID=A0ABS4JQV9_9FIRM|nr:tRNA glutamyl-Q(34) synthetase GluQRS [Symbiobacterium terraclitae]MBP2017923.1 glutamyl-tRNA synthetase [Symbiobacterium terraclitae]